MELPSILKRKLKMRNRVKPGTGMTSAITPTVIASDGSSCTFILNNDCNCINKELLNILSPASDKGRYPSESFLTLDEIHNRVRLLSTALLKHPGTIPPGKQYIFCPSLSDRQIFCSRSVCMLLSEKKFWDALHELTDCIDNFGEASQRIRNITPNEHALYTCLALNFLQSMESV